MYKTQKGRPPDLGPPQGSALSNLMGRLADLFAEEGTAAGDAAARALNEALPGALDSPAATPIPSTLQTVLNATLTAPGALPVTQEIAAAAPSLSWEFSGLKDGRIRREIALGLATCHILGPNKGMFEAPIRVGFFLQGAGLDYPIRRHAAAETFLILAGTADWACEGPHRPRPPGEFVQHPSMAGHASRTGAEPVLAAWHWTGDVGLESYRLEG